MANRFWTGLVGSGTGTWDNSVSLNWSTTSGGAGGAAAPTTGDSVIFDGNSGSGTVTIGSGAVGSTLVMTGYTGTLAFGTNKISLASNASATLFQGASTFTTTGTPLIELTDTGSGAGTRTIAAGAMSEANAISFNITGGTDRISVTGSVRSLNYTGFGGTQNANTAKIIYGNVTLSPTMTVTTGGNATYSATSGTQTITSNGVAWEQMFINAPGATVTLADALSIPSAGDSLRLINGTFNDNSKAVTITNFVLVAGTKTLTMGTGNTWTVTGSGISWDAATNVAGLTVNPGTATISMTSASAKTFRGGGKTWGILKQGGAGALTVTGANTFADIQATAGDVTVTLPASTTTTVSAFTLGGTSGHPVSLNSSSSGTAATLSKASGTVSVSNLSIKDSAATGGATWNAFTSNGNTDVSGNSGWVFTAVQPIPSTADIQSFLSQNKIQSFLAPGRI